MRVPFPCPKCSTPLKAGYIRLEDGKPAAIALCPVCNENFAFFLAPIEAVLYGAEYVEPPEKEIRQ